MAPPPASSTAAVTAPPARRVPSKPAAKQGQSGYATRLIRLKAALGASAVARLLVANPGDAAYLTGFLGGDSYLYVGGTKAAVISDFRFQEELEPVREAGLADIVIRKGSMPEAVGALLSSERATRIGIQAEHMTVGLRRAIGNS